MTPGPAATRKRTTAARAARRGVQRSLLATLCGIGASAWWSTPALGVQSPIDFFDATPAEPAAAPPPPTTTVGSPWDAALAASEDLTLWVRLREGNRLADSDEARACALGLLEILVPNGPTVQWEAIARRLELSPREAFLRYFGRDARLHLRAGRAGVGPDEWAIVTRVAPADIERLVTGLRPAVKGGGRYELPEESLAFASRDGWLVCSSRADGSLYQELVERGAAPVNPNLGAVVDSVGAQGLADGCVSAVLVGGGPLDGVSLLSADVRDGRLRVALRGVYAQPPFPGFTQSQLDVSMLARFDGSAIAVAVDPIRTRVGPEDAFLVATLPEIVPPAAFRNNLGGQRLILVGEVDGSRCDPPLAMRCPAVALAYEVEDPVQARDDQDALVKGLLEGVSARLASLLATETSASPDGPALDGQRTSLPAVPPFDSSDPGARHAAIRPMLEAIGADHPLVRGCSLNWDVVTGPAGSWQVYATDRNWLASVRQQLIALPKRDCDQVLTTTASAGRLCGQRVASHLRSWSGEATAFAGSDAAGFSKGIGLLAGVAERFGRIAWTVGRPDEHRLEISIDADLRPATNTAENPVATPGR